MIGPSSLWKQGACRVSGRSGLQEAGAELARESVVSTFLIHSRKEKDQDTNVAHSLKDRENLQKILEREVDSAVRGELLSQQNMFKAFEVEAKNWEKSKERQNKLVWRIGIEK